MKYEVVKTLGDSFASERTELPKNNCYKCGKEMSEIVTDEYDNFMVMLKDEGYVCFKCYEKLEPKPTIHGVIRIKGRVKEYKKNLK